jgi:hypothetical protein
VAYIATSPVASRSARPLRAARLSDIGPPPAVDRRCGNRQRPWCCPHYKRTRAGCVKRHGSRIYPSLKVRVRVGLRVVGLFAVASRPVSASARSARPARPLVRREWRRKVPCSIHNGIGQQQISPKMVAAVFRPPPATFWPAQALHLGLIRRVSGTARRPVR